MTPLHVDPQLFADLKLAEGCRLIAYRDTKGYWTIGYGHLLDQSIDWTGHEITQATADSLLEQDVIERGIGPAAGLPEWASLDTDCRRNALSECVFNLGVSHWKPFSKTRLCLQIKDWDGSARNLLASPEWVAEVGHARVARIAGYFQSGSYTPPSQ